MAVNQRQYRTLVFDGSIVLCRQDEVLAGGRRHIAAGNVGLTTGRSHDESAALAGVVGHGVRLDGL